VPEDDRVDWKVLIIGLIPLGVWILATIFRGIEDAREQEKPRPEPGERPLRTPRRPTSELDRFLEEARRRRDSSPKRPAEPVLEALPVPKPPEPAPPPRVERRPAKPREPRKAPEPAPQSVVLPVELPPPPPAPARLPARGQPSPALAKITAMLRDREVVATALALREIFDKPLSQR
jgi:hypothetical protein